MVNIHAHPIEGPLINGDGTSEYAWRECRTLSVLPEATLRPCDLAVVLAPHPDDETLGLGGTIATLLARGSTVIVVTASDGESSHPKSMTVSPDELRALRLNETRTALRVPGSGQRGNVLNVQLHLPDGKLAAVQEDMTDELLKFLGPSDLCFSTWEHDGHPDHEAVGLVTKAAAARCDAQLVEFAVWTWHWASPDEPTLPWRRARRVTLSGDDLRRKHHAIETYLSQIRPLSDAPGYETIFSASDLAHFQRPYEVVFV